jgi:hypothetical protein
MMSDYPMREVVGRFQVTQLGGMFRGVRTFVRWRLELSCGHRHYRPFAEGRRKTKLRCRQCEPLEPRAIRNLRIDIDSFKSCLRDTTGCHPVDVDAWRQELHIARRRLAVLLADERRLTDEY